MCVIELKFFVETVKGVVALCINQARGIEGRFPRFRPMVPIKSISFFPIEFQSRKELGLGVQTDASTAGSQLSGKEREALCLQASMP